MRRTHLVLGCLLLLGAAVMAIVSTDRSGDPERSARATPPHLHKPRELARGPVRTPLTPPLRPSARGQRPSGHSLPVLESLAVEPREEAHPALAAQAQRVQTGASSRLDELTAELDLREAQQREVFALLARSHPDYSGRLYLVGVPMSGPLDPLGKAAADRRIHKLLDPDQQLNFEIMAASADVWWTDVIARLERDLEQSTRDPAAAGRAPEHDPTPPKDDPPPAPAAPAPNNPRPNNLFDLLQDGGS